MPNLRSLHPTIRLAVACVVFAIGLRTWLVMGLIEPVTVAGSSMVPTLQGASVLPHCHKCQHSFRVGAEFAAAINSVACPRCANPRVSLDSLELHRADRLWIDRVSLRWRSPRRWETVVARNPDNAAELCIKRVVGLPGEHVRLRDGDVAIDGAVMIKTPNDQSRVRQLLHKESEQAPRWRTDDAMAWLQSADEWRHAANSTGASSWLRYRHPRDRPITDDVVYNAGLTRRLNLVDEFMLCADVLVRGKGSLRLAIDDGTASAEIGMDLSDGQLNLVESGRQTATFRLTKQSLDRITRGEVSLCLSNFDQQLLLLVDDRVELRRPWPNNQAAGTATPVAIAARGLELRLRELALFRDMYHTPYPAGTSQPLTSRWQLGPDEYFLLGDNSPVSIDSRLWGPVPRRLVIGRPLVGGR